MSFTIIIYFSWEALEDRSERPSIPWAIDFFVAYKLTSSIFGVEAVLTSSLGEKEKNKFLLILKTIQTILSCVSVTRSNTTARTSFYLTENQGSALNNLELWNCLKVLWNIYKTLMHFQHFLIFLPYFAP